MGKCIPCLFFCISILIPANAQVPGIGEAVTVGVYFVTRCESALASVPMRLSGGGPEFCMERIPVVHHGEVIAATVDDSGNVRLTLQEEAAQRLREQTGERVGQRVGVVVRRQLVNAPEIMAAVDQVVVGGLPKAEAEALVDVFRRGAQSRSGAFVLASGRPVQIYRIGSGGDSGPVPIRNEQPEYTDRARAARIQGSVLLKIVIGADGVPSDLEVLRGLDVDLDQKALECVAKWRFKPAMTRGKPVPVSANVEVNFRL